MVVYLSQKKKRKMRIGRNNWGEGYASKTQSKPYIALKTYSSNIKKPQTYTELFEAIRQEQLMDLGIYTKGLTQAMSFEYKPKIKNLFLHPCH